MPEEREAAKPSALPADALCARCDPESFTFATTDELDDVDGALGQERALAAIELGTRMAGPGYNLYVLGRSGSHKHQTVLQLLNREAERRGPAFDWCYLNNFDEPRKAIAVQLPAGKGIQLRDDMARLATELREVIPATFESDHYRNRIAEIQQDLEDRQKSAIEQLQEEAKAEGMSVVPTPHGFAIAPVKDGKVLPDEEFERLSEEEKQKLREAMGRMTERFRRQLREMPNWQKEHRDRIRALGREVTEYAAGQLIDQLADRYREHDAVIGYLDAVREDVLENARDFLPGHDQEAGPFASSQVDLSRYEVNLLVDNSKSKHVPVVYEQNPSVQNLTGRIEHVARFGALSTDFRMVRAGAVHRANGGYLVLDAERVLTHPFAWGALKRMLFSAQIRMESLDQFFSIVTTVSIEPEPIPLDIKLVLIGDRYIYYLLCQLDRDFANLFKVAADFEDDVDRSPENTGLYARLVATLARKEKLLPVSKHAVARVIERSARLVGDSEKLSMQLRSINDLLRESDYWAKEDDAPVIDARHVQRAIDAQTHRLERVRSRIQEGIARDRILIDTEGSAVGQVNGLSVLKLGEFSFGQPSRITATVRLGDGKIIDIERETELGGPIHSKGVLIVSSYIASKYALDVPLSFGASLVFEQSYGGVEGDSASVAETCALLSALAGVPLRQDLAVTGSVNQHGRVQVIGGVNEKIEGFFDTCEARGLTGKQGVLIPDNNVKDLMLREDVVDKARAGDFAVYPISTIDQAASLLTGLPAGERGSEGRFPEGSLNARVERRLLELATARRAFGQKDGDRDEP